MDIQALYAELRTDPLGRGYSGMSDDQLWDSLTAKNRRREKPTLTGAEIYNAIVPNEWVALTTTQQNLVRDVFHLAGPIDVRTGTNARTALLNVFGAGTQTRANLAALVNVAISRLEELNCGDLTKDYLIYLRSLPF